MNTLGSRHAATDAKLVSIFALIALVFGCAFLAASIAPAPSGTGGARSAGLLWAAACCAVGCFIGFIFGIPRTLSSDTARTTVPLRAGAIDRAKAKAADSREKAERAAQEKNQAADQAQQYRQSLETAAASVARAQTNQAGGGATAVAELTAARQQMDEIQKKKQVAEKALQDKLAAANAADAEAKKDQDAFVALGQADDTPAGTRGGRGPSTAINTNLEQISDWLTKIIVGVSLVNSERIGARMQQAAGQIGVSLGSGDNSSIAMAIIVYFGVLGLLGGYLLTRLFLQPAFNAANAPEPA